MSTAGPRACGTGTDGGLPGAAWTNPGNITADDANYATSSSAPGTNTRNLKATNFGFSIPAGSTINGIQFAFKWKKTAGTPQLILCQTINASGVIGGTNLADGYSVPATEESKTYGATNQLWGRTWLASDINDVDFGVAFSFASGDSGAISINYVTATIAYTEAPKPTDESGAIHYYFT